MERPSDDLHDQPDTAETCARGWHRVVNGQCEAVDLWDTGEVRLIPRCSEPTATQAES